MFKLFSKTQAIFFFNLRLVFFNFKYNFLISCVFNNISCYTFVHLSLINSNIFGFWLTIIFKNYFINSSWLRLVFGHPNCFLCGNPDKKIFKWNRLDAEQSSNVNEIEILPVVIKNLKSLRNRLNKQCKHMTFDLTG